MLRGQDTGLIPATEIVTAARFPNVVITSNYRVTIRSAKVFCLGEYPVGRLCPDVFHRCERSE